jgi:nicotinate-nucleotide--dimethylbenzimidazole phosphoribosyltransferase
MGIGNTTSAAAVLAALTGAPSEAVVGPGTGVSGEALAHKGAVVARAIEVNRPSASDPIGLLAALGGLEIAAMAGAVIGAAAEGVCVVIDGFISSVAALVAARLCPECLSYMLASHRSAEPGHGVALEALDLSPLLDLEMRLGEGTGAVLAMAVAGAACAMMSEMATFDEAGVSGPVA